MKIRVTRTFEPITKDVTTCRECPWYFEDRDMNSTLPVCEHPKFNGGKGGYDAIIPDVSPWPNRGSSIDRDISKLCPLI